MKRTFSLSANIENGFAEGAQYIVTPNAQKAISSIVNDFHTGIHSFTIIGSYGTGKSSFLLALESDLKRRGKTPTTDLNKLKNKDNLSEKEFIINKKNIKEKFDVISQIDKMSNYSEKIKYDLISENNNNNKKKTKNIETFFNKIIKPNHNNISNIINNNNNNNNKKQKPMINIRTKFNNFSKKEIETPIKLKNIDNNNYSTIKIIKYQTHIYH